MFESHCMYDWESFGAMWSAKLSIYFLKVSKDRPHISLFVLMWNFFKVFIEFVAILLLLYVLVFWPGGMWDLSCLTKDWTRTACIRRWSLNRWTAREVPGPLILKQQFGSFPSKMLFTHMLAHIKAYLLLLCPVPWKVFCSWRGFMEKIIHKV